MPKLYRDEGVVLRTHKLGEADRIIVLLTRENGMVRAVAKGVRRTSSKFGSRLEPFMVADLQLYRGRSMDIVTQAVTLAPYGAAIAADYARFTAANSMAEVAGRLAEAASGVQQYLLLIGALRSLARGDHDPASTLDSYLLRALSVAGWAPSFDACVRCGAPGPHRHLVVQMGGALCDSCAPPGAPRVDRATLEHLGALLEGRWAAVEEASEATRKAAGDIAAAYAQWHVERGLRSLRLVGEPAAAVTSSHGKAEGLRAG